jgi:beta-glucosidase-like glycosyl hydrolase
MPRTSRSHFLTATYLTLFHSLAVTAALTGQALLDKYSSGVALNDNQLAILAGYHTVYSWPGGTLPRRLLNLAAAGKVGGVIIFGENVNDDLPAQIQSLQDAYADGPAYDGTPMLITTDQEGGEVVRLPGGPDESEKDIGSSANPPKAAASAGAVAAQACEAYNVNGMKVSYTDIMLSLNQICLRQPRPRP